MTLVTKPAALNDVFEHAQLEYFHGRPDNLHFTRSKRLESLASRGHATSSSTYSFASTEDVIADAKVAAARRRLAPGIVDGMQPKQSRKPPLVPARPLASRTSLPAAPPPWSRTALSRERRREAAAGHALAVLRLSSPVVAPSSPSPLCAAPTEPRPGRAPICKMRLSRPVGALSRGSLHPCPAQLSARLSTSRAIPGSATQAGGGVSVLARLSESRAGRG